MANQLNGWWYASDAYLTEEHRRDNAKLVRDFFAARGWTINAICAMLGNMEVESTINPGLIEGRKQSLSEDDGYGLTQWTPYTKLSNWATRDGLVWMNDGGTQCKRIQYEMENELQWITNIDISFRDFSQSTESLQYLTIAFCRNYERPKNPDYAQRVANARKWYKFLHGLPVWLYFQFKRRRW